VRKRKKAKNDLRDERMAAGWVYLKEVKVEGKKYPLMPGRELKIKGSARGSIFRFHELVRRPDGVEWITVYGGPSGHGQWHSFELSRVSWISRKLPKMV